MGEKNIPRIVIGAVHSGSGKTTIVTGILAALREQGYAPQSYKIGPDYIDPGYHELASGRKGHNLDSWLVSEEKIQDIFCSTAGDADIAIIEGVMGLYDGGKNGISSTAAIAKLLKAPVILVIDVKAMGDSAAAIALGFKSYDPEVNLAGVILNRVGSLNHKQMVENALEKLSIPVLGAVFRDQNLQLPERHLGLVPTTENETTDRIGLFAQRMAADIDLPRLREIATAAVPLQRENMRPKQASPQNITIAVAKDDAFSFYYPESLAALEQQGANIVFFSPLADQTLPPADGIFLGGGFPEVFAQQLSENKPMLLALRAAAQKKQPIYAECGGFMYLTEALVDFSGKCHAMAGVIPGSCRMNEKLQTVGYVKAQMRQNTLLGMKSSVLRGHEFHFSSYIAPTDLPEYPWAFTFTKNRNNQQYAAGYASERILGSYLHLHFAGCPQAGAAFIENCRAYQAEQKQEAK